MNKPTSAMPFAAEFKLGMRSLAGAVSIITCGHEGRLYGMTAASSA